MRCCVAGCKNDSRHISKSQGITFHVFPNETSSRTAWLQALGKVNWEPKERSAVCSDHFLYEDLYETKSGLRKVKSGAVPFVMQSPLPKNSSTSELKEGGLEVCRACLTMDCKLFKISRHKNLKQAYETLTDLMMCANDKLPQNLCSECAMRLVNFYRFRVKCLKANSLMMDIIKKHSELTIQNIKAIDREGNLLSSSLLWEMYPPNYCNYYLDSEAKEPDIKHEITNEIYINEDINENIRENTPDTQDMVIVTDDDVKTDVSYLHSGSISESDDSLPLEKARKKKVEKRAVKVRKKKIKPEPAQPKIDRRRKPFLNDDLNETLFTITNLSHEEQIADIEKRRESSNYKNAVFKCTECYKGFLDEDAYNTHIMRHTDQCGEHACDICKTHFKHPHALRKHITAHHTQRFSCNQCVYVTTHRQTARLHERWHKGTKYQCPHCQDEFVKFTTYMGHIRIKHPSDFVCELCGYSFVSIKGIQLHKRLKHRLEDGQIPEDGPFCEQCNVKFLSVEAHRRHLSVSARHSAGREANKPKVGRKSKETMEREKRMKEKNREPDDKRRVYPSQMRKAEGPIPCEQCGMQLEDSRAYHGHFRRMHPDKNRTMYPSMKSPCMCEVCGRMFQSYALLKDHCWVHTGERPFKCDVCDKSFRMKQRLVAHRRVHSQMKVSYACSLCGKNFSTHSNRQRHMIIHTGLKPFKCEMCDKGFKHASEKRAHITYVHLKKPWPKRSRGKRRTDTRQGMAPQQALPTDELDPAEQIWPPLDPKMSLIEEKPMYYTMKI